jgi:hypothetical protein
MKKKSKFIKEKYPDLEVIHRMKLQRMESMKEPVQLFFSAYVNLLQLST